VDQPSSQSFLARNEFLIRRLHSLSGLIPVGAYMTVHLLTNSSILASSQKFQGLVYQIHALGPALPFVEWGLIFLPLIFHAVVGVVILKSGMTNTSSYSNSSNYRYMLQRATGMIAFVFIFWHVFHMHGWFHSDWWTEGVAEPLNGHNFSAYSAASSAARALASPIIALLYAVGVLSCVFHLANGLWTMGITWGLWVSPAAQRRANWLAIAFGVGLAFVSMGALTGFATMSKSDIAEAEAMEKTMFEEQVKIGAVSPDSHKYAPNKKHDDEVDGEHDAESESETEHGDAQIPGDLPDGLKSASKEGKTVSQLDLKHLDGAQAEPIVK